MGRWFLESYLDNDRIVVLAAGSITVESLTAMSVVKLHCGQQRFQVFTEN